MKPEKNSKKSNLSKSVGLDLTEGPIFQALIRLTLPIIGSSFIMMLHSILDIWCVSRLGTAAASSVGTGGFYIWLSASLGSITRIGTQVKVAQSIGEKKQKETASYIKTGILLAGSFGITLGFLLYFFRFFIIGFHKFPDSQVTSFALLYLATISFAMPFFFLNPVFTAICQALGNSKLPFYINTFGLCLNFILNFCLIFGLGPFPSLKVFGAALATLIAQGIIFLLFIFFLFLKGYCPFSLTWKKLPPASFFSSLFFLGLPYGIHESLFTLISIVISRFVAGFGSREIAANRVGAQIEAISWQSASGFSSALTAFVGQNFGAKKIDRIWRAYRTTILLSISIGLFATFLFFFGGTEIFLLFFPKEPETVKAGALYLEILGYSQVFMCIEITTAGFFHGIGKTQIPSIVGIVFTALRIPFAYFGSKLFGVQAIWWVITLSCIIKGTCLMGAYFYYKRKKDSLY